MPGAVQFPEHGNKEFLWDLRPGLAHPCNHTANLSYMAQRHGPVTNIGDGWLTRPGSLLDACLEKEGFLPTVSRQENWLK